MKENIKVTITEKATELPAETILIKGLMEGLLIATNYKETVTACDALLTVALEYPVTIVRAADRIRVLINTPNRKTLAEGIVDAICHYFGDTSHNPANTADPDIIIKRATAWAQAQPDADLLNPQDYAGCVVLAINKLLESSNPTLSLKPRRFDEAEHNAIVDKVQEWYNKKMVQPQPLNDEQPADSVPGVPDEQRAKPQAIDDRILKLLPELYDLLVEKKVIAVSLSKSDFVRNMTNGEVPKMRKDDPKTWVLRKIKFREFVFQIKHYFDSAWHAAVCRSAGLTREQMDKRNTNNTEEFRIIIERFLKKNGMK